MLRSHAEGKGIAASVAQLCTALFADFCSVYVRNEGPFPVAMVARSGSGAEALAAAARDDGYVDRARLAGIETLVEEPLVASNRVLGTLVVGMSGTRKLTTAHRRSLAHVVEILSTALDQAQQLAIHYHVSKRLQQAMLPSCLPDSDSVAFDAAYLPATAGADVGGDWYDTFDLGRGVIGLSVGDVVGHGLEAAVAMSEIRSAIRATASTVSSPAAVLRVVDELMCAQSVGMATAIVGFYETTTGVLRYASCGHPSPALLTPSGRSVLLPAGGLMLGLGTGTASDDFTVTVPRGGTLFFYTDGLLEYGHDVIAGEQTLLEALATMELGEEHPAEALHAFLFRGGVENADDCATLALRRAASSACTSERLVYSSIAPCAALARDALRAFSEPHLFERDRCFEVLSAVGEAVANAIEHGTHGDHQVFEIEARADDGGIVVDVRSPGHWRPFTPSIDRGRGLHIMRTYAKRLEISSAQDETHVTLTFAKP